VKNRKRGCSRVSEGKLGCKVQSLPDAWKLQDRRGRRLYLVVNCSRLLVRHVEKHGRRRLCRYMTYSERQSSRASSTRCQLGPGWVLLPTAHSLTHSCVHWKRLGYCSNDVPTITELSNSSDDDFFYSVKTNSTHVLHPYFPDQTHIPYGTVSALAPTTCQWLTKPNFLTDTDFIICMLYKYSY